MRKLAKRTLGGLLVTDKLDKVSNLNLDVVYVTTPIPSHYGIVKEIYARGIARNVFVEKTLSSNHAQSEELCNLASASKGHTMVGYMKRFSVTFRKAKELLDQGVVGALDSFDAYAYSSDFLGVKRDSGPGARGGVLEDLGSHVSDLALWLLGDLLSSFKVSSSTDPRSDSVQFQVVGSNDFAGEFDISWAKEGYRMPEFGLTIRGTKGTIRVDDTQLVFASDSAQPKTWHRQDLDDHVTFFLGESEYFRENDHFIKSIIHNSKSEPNFQTATEVDCLLEHVRCKANE
jgi:predicted dehydrogenase